MLNHKTFLKISTVFLVNGTTSTAPFHLPLCLCVIHNKRGCADKVINTVQLLPDRLFSYVVTVKYSTRFVVGTPSNVEDILTAYRSSLHSVCKERIAQTCHNSVFICILYIYSLC